MRLKSSLDIRNVPPGMRTYHKGNGVWRCLWGHKCTFEKDPNQMWYTATHSYSFLAMPAGSIELSFFDRDECILRRLKKRTLKDVRPRR